MTKIHRLIRIGDARRLTQGTLTPGLPEDFLPGHYMPG